MPLRFWPTIFRGATIPSALLVLIGGCHRGSSDQLGTRVVASAAGTTLSAATLERWLVASPSRPTSTTAHAAVGIWIDAALLATAAARGPALDDSATVDDIIRPDAERGLSLEFLQERAASRPPVTDASADSLFHLDRVRVFQLWQLHVPPTADSGAVALAAQRAGTVLARARTGVNFTTLVRESSEDSALRATDGFLGAMTRNDLPPQVTAALWVLRPGEVSPLLHGSVGFEIFRRATAAESRPGLKVWLRQGLDSMFIDSLGRARHLQVTPDAAARLRSIAVEPVVAPDGPPLVTWDGGAVQPATARKWLMTFTPAERAAMTLASDSAATAYLEQVGKNEIIIALAIPSGILPARARAALAPEFRRVLPLIIGNLRRTGGNLSPGDLANAYVDAVLAHRVQPQPLPGALAAVLRSRYPVQLDHPAIDAVVKLAGAEWDAEHAGEAARRAQPRP